MRQLVSSPNIKPTTPLGLLFLRLYLNRTVRRIAYGITVLVAVATVAVLVLAYDSRQGKISNWFRGGINWVNSHPQLAVTNVKIEGASPDTSRKVAEIIKNQYGLAAGFGKLHDLRQAMLELPAIRDVTISLESTGRLVIVTEEITPVVLLERDGQFLSLDIGAAVLSASDRRSKQGNLPLIAGAGAEDYIEEALGIFGVSPKLSSMTRGLVRIGQRRWDMVLDHGRVAKLPEENPALAVGKLMALDRSDNILSLDIEVIDLRNPNRITIRPAADIEEVTGEAG